MSDRDNNSGNGADEANLRRLSDEEPKQAAAGSETQSGNQSETEGLAQQLEKAKTEFLYLRAEFDNFRKQTIKERSDMRKYGCERLVVDLLNVLDIFDTALTTQVTADNFENFRKGLEMTAGELRSTLSKHGIEEIPALGQPFDPNAHEAISSEETEKIQPGHISRVFKKAYKLHDRVIRPAQVVVAKGKA